MAGGISKILVASTLTNAASAYLLTTTVSSVGIGNLTAMNAGVSSAQYIPAGMYVLPTSTNNVTIEVNTGAAGINNWVTYIAANTGGTIISDGYNMRGNATTSTQTLTLYGVNGGQAATGQYNS
jgi:uncharacterized protein YigE (DUF2233 family)